MGWGQSELQYRKAAAYSSSPVGSVLMLYDQLLKDLRKAGAAMRDYQYEACANEIKHALTVIQQLEGSLDRDTGESVVPWLVRFYSLLRTGIVDAQVKFSPQGLEEQAARVLDVREAWQELESRNNSVSPLAAPPTQQPVVGSINHRRGGDDDTTRSSWTA